MTTRGTTNRNDRGSVADRRRRREWLVQTFRADVDVVVINGQAMIYSGTVPGVTEPTCRCYRCGVLLTVDTVSADRIIPGCQGGTYRRDNIRPACPACQSEVGGALRRSA